MYSVLKAVQALGGSGTSREITAAAVEAEGFSDELLAVTYEGRDKSIVLDRFDWARSYCKLGGVLESPRRGLFLITTRGQEIAACKKTRLEACCRNSIARSDGTELANPSQTPT